MGSSARFGNPSEWRSFFWLFFVPLKVPISVAAREAIAGLSIEEAFEHGLQPASPEILKWPTFAAVGPGPSRCL
jgi:hypothetical protein